MAIRVTIFSRTLEEVLNEHTKRSFYIGKGSTLTLCNRLFAKSLVYILAILQVTSLQKTLYFLFSLTYIVVPMKRLAYYQPVIFANLTGEKMASCFPQYFFDY